MKRINVRHRKTIDEIEPRMYNVGLPGLPDVHIRPRGTSFQPGNNI